MKGHKKYNMEEEIREMEEVERELASISPEDLRDAPPEEAAKIERDLRAFADAYLEKEAKYLSIRIPMGMFIELKQRARSKGLAPSTLLRMLLKAYLNGDIEITL